MVTEIKEIERLIRLNQGISGVIDQTFFFTHFIIKTLCICLYKTYYYFKIVFISNQLRSNYDFPSRLSIRRLSKVSKNDR